MRILLAADIVGGVRTFVRELVGELAARDVEVHLALLGTGAAGEFERLGARSCQIRNLRLEWMEDPWADVEATAAWVEELCGHHGPDVLHMNTFAPARPEGVPLLLTVHSCVLTWWRAVRGCEAPAAWDRYRRLARADVLTTPTRALLHDLGTVYGRLPRAVVVPNGRTPPAPGAPRAERERLVLSVGRLWDEAKNVRLLARAAPAINGRVAVIGPGPAPEGVESLGVHRHSAVLRWLTRAAVFAEPARYEPFGLATLEAALCGCALVLGDIPSLREVWGDAASFVAPDDQEALAAAVNQLLADPSRRGLAARAGYAAARRYSPAPMADAYLDAYRQLVRAAVAA
jgi:glycosyltransferase involved in cell wall biosynthesis